MVAQIKGDRRVALQRTHHAIRDDHYRDTTFPALSRERNDIRRIVAKAHGDEHIAWTHTKSLIANHAADTIHQRHG